MRREKWGGVLAGAEEVGEVHDAVRLDGHDGLDDVLKAGDVAAHDSDGVAVGGVVGAGGVEVDDDDLLAALDEEGDGASADEASAAENEGGHVRSFVVGLAWVPPS